jgi:hypothetical protein
VDAESNGRLPAIYVNPDGGAYKVVVTSASDTDPPTSPFWTEDNIPAVGQAAFPVLSEYADDAAAALGGVEVGELYRTASAVKQRVA